MTRTLRILTGGWMSTATSAMTRGHWPQNVPAAILTGNVEAAPTVTGNVEAAPVLTGAVEI